MCAKNHLLIFSSFLDIWENVEWPRFFWTTLYVDEHGDQTAQTKHSKPKQSYPHANPRVRDLDI